MSLNDENERCNQCHKLTVPIFQNGRKKWCPSCEGVSKQPKEEQQKTVKIDLDDFLSGPDYDDSFKMSVAPKKDSGGGGI